MNPTCNSLDPYMREPAPHGTQGRGQHGPAGRNCSDVATKEGMPTATEEADFRHILQNWERRDACCLKPASLWSFVIVAKGVNTQAYHLPRALVLGWGGCEWVPALVRAGNTGRGHPGACAGGPAHCGGRNPSSKRLEVKLSA